MIPLLVVIVLSAIIGLYYTENYVNNPAKSNDFVMHPYNFMSTLAIAALLTLVCTAGYLMFTRS
jgi:hypothetical protein